MEEIEKDFGLDEITEETKAYRLACWVLPDISIELKIKSGGGLNYFSIRKDIQYFLGEKCVLWLLKAVLKEENRVLEVRKERLIKIMKIHPPQSIIDHEKMQIKKKSWKQKYISEVISALESPNRKFPSRLPPMINWWADEIEGKES
jgi:hypothetical protein